MKANFVKLYSVILPDGKRIGHTAYAKEGYSWVGVGDYCYFLSRSDAELFIEERKISGFRIEKTKVHIARVQQYTPDGYPSSGEFWQTNVARMAKLESTEKSLYFANADELMMRRN